MQEIVHSETREYADGTYSTSSFDADGKLVSLEIRQACSGRNPAFDQDGRLMLTPALERVVEERVRAGITQLACDLLDACRGGGGITTQKLRRALKPYAAEATHTCGCCEQEFAGECRYWTTPAATVAKVCLVCHDQLQEVGVRIGHTQGFECATEQAWVEVRQAKCLVAIANAFCVICNNTGLDPYSQGPCYGCARPNSPAPQPADAGCPACNGSRSDPHLGGPSCRAAQSAPSIPNPPTSRCCGVGVFEDRGRLVCVKCRVGCKLR